MFENDITKLFSCSRSKVSYLITDALGPYFKELLKKDINDSCFTLLYDETTNSESKKELQVQIKYWSVGNKVQTRHLETFFIPNGTAETIKNHLIIAMDNFDLKVKNLVMLGSDGPNVNKKVSKNINEWLKELGHSKLIDIGTCNLHMVHNVFLKSLNAFGNEISDFIIDIYYFFKQWPTRKADFEEIQRKFNKKNHSFIKHVSSRWLTISDAVKRILEQIEPLNEYFLKFIPRNRQLLLKTAKYNRIQKVLKSDLTLPTLYLILESSSIFSSFLLTFQKNTPLIHIIFDKLKELRIQLCHKLSLELNDDLILEDAFKNINSEKICLNKDIEISLKNLKEINVLSFKKSYIEHYKTGLLQLDKYIDSNQMKKLKLFKCLSLTELDCYDFSNLAKFLKIDADTGMLMSEVSLLKNESLVSDCNEINDIDVSWNKLFELKNPLGQKRFPIMELVVKKALILSCCNADVERGFSISGQILSEFDTQMSLRMLNSRLYIKDGLQNTPLNNFVISKDLINKGVMAHNHYQNYVFSKKEEEARLEQKKKQQETQSKRKAEAISQKNEIDDIERQIEELKKKHLTGAETSLFEESRNRLNDSLKKGDLKEAMIANAMFEGTSILMKKKASHEEEINKLEAELKLKKNLLINKKIKTV